MCVLNVVLKTLQVHTSLIRMTLHGAGAKAWCETVSNTGILYKEIQQTVLLSCVNCDKTFKLCVVEHNRNCCIVLCRMFFFFFPCQHGSTADVCPSDSSRRGDPSGSSGSENPHDPSALSTHNCQSEQTTCAKLCCGSFFSAGLQLPWAKRQLTSDPNHQTPEPCTQGHCTTKSLMELLVSGLCFETTHDSTIWRPFLKCVFNDFTRLCFWAAKWCLAYCMNYFVRIQKTPHLPIWI